MKQTIIGLLILLVIIVISLKGVRTDLYIYLTNVFHNSKLPTQFKDYQNIYTDELISTHKHEIELLFKENFYPIKCFINNQNNIEIIEKKSSDNKPGTFTIHKYNNDGELTSKLTNIFNDSIYQDYSNSMSEILTTSDTYNQAKFTIIPRYFQKTRKVGIYSGSIGGNSGSGYGSSNSTSYNTFWKGNLFFDLIIKGDTLKLKDSFILDSNSKKEKQFIINGKNIGILKRFHMPFSDLIVLDGNDINSIPYTVYTTEAIHFFLLKKEGGKIYSIKQKQ